MCLSFYQKIKTCLVLLYIITHIGHAEITIERHVTDSRIVVWVHISVDIVAHCVKLQRNKSSMFLSSLFQEK